jgi:SHS2 domain-containing protein
MKPYEILEHTADVGLKANGLTLKELFENAARGMFAIISGVEDSNDAMSSMQRRIEIKKEAEELEELLVNWLSELLYIFNKEKILFSSFKILELNNSGIIGDAYGENIDPSHSVLQTEIKAVTFHGLKIQKNLKDFSCNIIFDV